jgi:hypothetical protein
METLLFICVVTLCTTQTNAQMRDTTVNKKKVDANYLLKKSKNQKIPAFVLLGAGAGLLVAGNSVAANGSLDQIGSGLAII